MMSDDERDLSLEVAKIIEDHEDRPTWYVAEKIVKVCLRKVLDRVKSRYERLFYTPDDRSN